MLCDAAAEWAVLGGVFQHGSDAYFDVADILHPDSFTVSENKAVWNCVRHIFEKKNDVTLDESMLLSTAIELGYDKILNSNESLKHIRAIINKKTSLQNVRSLAAKIRKLHIANQLSERCGVAIEELQQLSGEETIDKILSIPESKIFELNDVISQRTSSNTSISDGLFEHLEYIENNPVDMIGISTGYRRYDEAIGGGLRRKEIDIIGARMKVGKSMYVDNVAINIAIKQGIPVINLDTEMSREQHWYRILSNMTGIKKKYIETGQYAQEPRLKEKVRLAAQQLKNSPYYYECISGKQFEDVLATLRRWLHRDVGYDDNGKIKDCVIIYDYLKLIDDTALKGNMQEYQALGFMMMSLKNFCIRYDVPCLAFMQLNRDGIDEETTGVASGSDRILMFCSSFSIFKPKSDEEIAEDTVKGGNRKLIPIICRNGGGLDYGDYINLHFEGDFSSIVELKTKKEIMVENKNTIDEGFDNEINDDDSDIPFADE